MNPTRKLAQIGLFLVIILSLLFAGLQPERAKAAPRATTIWPIYFELAIDETRGWIYGSDPTGAKVDVISISTLQLVKSFSLPGTSPHGIALSPDGSELAVANYDPADEFNPPPVVRGSIIFIDPDTGITVTLVPNSYYLDYNRPWDVVYGRPGRLYSSGNPGGGGLDHIHAIDTTTHSEINRSPFLPVIRSAPLLQISPDFNTLYVSEATKFYSFDVSTDDPPSPLAETPSYAAASTSFAVSPDGTKLFDDSGEVWDASLNARIGRTFQGYLDGIHYQQLVMLPTHGALAVA